MEIVAFIAVFVVSFLLGSIPSGVIISRVFFHKDIRDTGSGNIGTTNAMRAMGKKGGVVVFLMDFGKGVLSGLLAGVIAGVILSPSGLTPEFGQICLCGSFIGCILGHIFCPWLGFHGGKGVAVAIGCMFMTLGPIGSVVEIVVFAGVVLATKMVSAGSVSAAVVFPFLTLYFYWGNPVAWVFCLCAALIVIWAHRGNIERIKNGTERRIGESKEK